MTGILALGAALVRAGVWIGAGTLLGAVYFQTLRWSVDRLADGASLLTIFAAQSARFALAAAAFYWVAARFGALPLLAAAAGFVAARVALASPERPR